MEPRFLALPQECRIAALRPAVHYGPPRSARLRPCGGAGRLRSRNALSAAGSAKIGFALLHPTKCRSHPPCISRADRYGNVQPGESEGSLAPAPLVRDKVASSGKYGDSGIDAPYTP